MASLNSSESAGDIRFKRNKSILTNISVTKLKSRKLSQKKAFLVSTIIDLKNKRSFSKQENWEESDSKITKENADQ